MSSPYDTFNDPYCYENTFVLKNIFEIKNQEKLDELEADFITLRLQENFPQGDFDEKHYKAIHHHLFQDVYIFAGKYRSVRISKGGNMFCYPEHIENEIKTVFEKLQKFIALPNINRAEFVKNITRFLSDINAIHPFREGNGRTQTAFIFLLAKKLNITFDDTKLDADKFLAAMIQSFHGKEEALKKELENIFESHF